MNTKRLNQAVKTDDTAQIEFGSTKDTPRSIFKVVPAREQSEGVGARVRRSIGGSSTISNFTPFLMLDHFKVSPDAGFPDHPHRGQETITYMIKGHVDHEDFTGSSGTLGPGDLQFMTAGKGIVHAEMPRIDKAVDGNIKHVEGLQLWVDLPQKLKMCKPRYRDLRAVEIPIVKPDDKVTIKVISGESYGVDSIKNLAYTPVWFLDCTIAPGGMVDQTLPEKFNAFVYVLEGEVTVLNRKVKAHHTVFLNTDGDRVNVCVKDNAGTQARVAIIAGEPLTQPIVQRGPFVETSAKRVTKAFDDYVSGTNGFERAVGWESRIGKRIKSR
ncbi:uncharacterized protein SAPINGB_P004191 [Magnusiomyces paraingens]|uniref:Pirin n=1 Tax=Magnusiomyces paraingens TaxID=2606893 RepID=A0A5E8BSF8_9ASCO|nr:uncharacterized protein SAPINGB_P004191 [Saprochaete ingens]VVT54668.1 unnamed protein product [Saprochaete ingens]